MLITDNYEIPKRISDEENMINKYKNDIKYKISIVKQKEFGHPCMFGAIYINSGLQLKNCIASKVLSIMEPSKKISDYIINNEELQESWKLKYEDFSKCSNCKKKDIAQIV